MKHFLNKEKIAFLLILLLAAYFRFYGVDWDQSQHLHPDERFLTMVSGAITWPQTLNEYFDTNTSPLNPQNRNFPFFVYGTFPIFLTKAVAELLKLGDYTNLTLVGRTLSALFDLGTVGLVLLIAKSLKTPRGWQAGVATKAMTPPMVKESEKDNWSASWRIGLFAAFFYAASVLPIQLSHFYAVDTYLTFFLTLSFYLLIKLINCKYIGNYSILLGLSFGLAAASKISAVYFSPIIGLGLLYSLFKRKKFIPFIVHCSLFILSFYFTLRLAQPYLFANPNIFDITLNPKVLANWEQLKSFDDPKSTFPPGIQWIMTKPYAYPLKNIILWGLGLPLGVISILAVFYSIATLLHCYIVDIKKLTIKQPALPAGRFNNVTIQKILNNKQKVILSLMTLWIVFLFAYQGSQFVKAMRYFFPIYPFLAILSAYFVYQLGYCLPRRRDTTLVRLLAERKDPVIRRDKLRPWEWRAFYWGIIGLLLLIYPISFLSIYSHPHSRIYASEWIYSHIPAGSTITMEVWDDGLPVPLPNQSSQIYKGIAMPLYDADTPEKWQKIGSDLAKIDYIILTSNRLYGSIMTVPDKYPITNRFYQLLFDGSLGFTKIAEFTSRPNLPIPGIKVCLTPPFVRYGIVALPSQDCPHPGISFVDDYADESFTVYDHPKVIVFKKVQPTNYLQSLPIPNRKNSDFQHSYGI